MKKDYLTFDEVIEIMEAVGFKHEEASRFYNVIDNTSTRFIFPDATMKGVMGCITDYYYCKGHAEGLKIGCKQKIDEFKRVLELE